VTSSPIVDVLIPVFNAAATLRAAVESILSQSTRNLRVVVVDDGSTDQTPVILSELARADQRISILTKPNSGIVDTLNAGIECCESEFIARFDADDIAYPQRLEWQLEYLTRNPDCVAVGGAVEHIDEHGQPLLGLPQPGQPSLADAAWAPAREPYLIHPFLMVRRAAIARTGGYRYVHNSEDSDLLWRLAELGKLHNLERPVGQYRVHTKSISSASILNGRIMAVSSQLAAISATRRRAGRQDLIFSPGMRDEYRAQLTLDKICQAASTDLDEREAQHLRIAAAAKLMELARYRPYEIEISDCTFIRSALPQAELLPLQNQREIRWYVTVTAARLVRKLKIAEALALAPLATLPIVAARTLLPRSGIRAHSIES
jgi:glycosyltransferase involved in cell wall biosynthesis